MKTPCEATQRQLLALTDPVRPPLGVQAHLDVCPTCREWQKQIVEVDRTAAQLPWPPSTTKSAFLQRLKSQPSRQQRLRGRTWQLSAAWSAAAVLLFILLYHLAHTPDTPTPTVVTAPAGEDRWLTGLMQQHRALAQADSTSAQIQGLAGLADDVQERTQMMSRFVEVRDLRQLAELYGRAIHTSLQRAGELPLAERRPVLEPIARQLVRARENADRRAREDRVGSADHPLITIATAAQAGKAELDALLNEQTRARVTSGPCTAMLSGVWLTRIVRARAAADGPRAITTAEDLAHFERNRPIVEALFASGIHLAEKSDLVSRAGHCNPLVAVLAREIAASRRDSARAAELARHLRGLLTAGVAHNLARGGVPALPGSLREKQLLAVGNETLRTLDQLEAVLRSAQPQAWEEIQVGRREVEIAIQGRGTPR